MFPSQRQALLDLVRAVPLVDDVAHEHRRKALSWLADTEDVYRRVKPRTPDPHLVSYFLMIDVPLAASCWSITGCPGCGCRAAGT